jgi:hypothetical protein
MRRYKCPTFVAAIAGLVVLALGVRGQGQNPTAPRLLLDRFPNVLGSGGVSADFGETNLGGATVAVKLAVGR